MKTRDNRIWSCLKAIYLNTFCRCMGLTKAITENNIIFMLSFGITVYVQEQNTCMMCKISGYRIQMHTKVTEKSKAGMACGAPALLSNLLTKLDRSLTAEVS